MSTGQNSTREDNRPTFDDIAAEAQRALKDRPKLTIRSRVVLSFAIFLILSLGLAIALIITINRINDKLLFVEAVTSYTFEIQQARRFEKNFFLYNTNLKEALDNVHLAQEILYEESDNIASEIGESQYKIMLDHVASYERLLSRLAGLEDGQIASSSSAYKEIEAELRDHGAHMVEVASQLVSKERTAVNDMLARSRQIPIVFLLVLIILIIYIGVFIGKQMLAPLNRMIMASKRIAKGDFTPLRPVRRFYDEFSELAVAMNQMVRQLVHRQELLVQAHKLHAVGTLTAGVAHELNNPINNIMLTASLLQEDYEDTSEEEKLDMIGDLVSQSERAQRIVRNLLDFARESDIISEPHDAQGIIEETLQLASNQIKLSKVKVQGEIDDNMPPVYCDRQQITQVFLNIVLNALDAMPHGGNLSITLRNAKDRDYVVAMFTDTGKGMSDQVLRNIFDPFYTTKPQSKGTGLGLSVSLGIIKQHGGDISVQSEVNQGTTFTIRLPVAKVPADITDANQENEEDGGEEDLIA